MKDVFGLFSDRVIELLNHSFSPMYRRVFKGYWDNSMFARMRKAYFHSDIQNGYYECYIPTFESVEVNMKYYRIAVQVVPELSKEIMKQEAAKLHHPRITPVGVVDSQLLCIIAPTRTSEAKKSRQFIRGYKTKAGFLVGAFLSKLPESCVKRVLTVITQFIKKRLVAFLSSFHLEERLQHKHRINTLYYSNVTSIVERISLSLANAVRCLSHCFHWLKTKIRHIYAEVGRQNLINEAMHRINVLTPLLKKIRFSPQYLQNNATPLMLSQLMTVVCGG